MRVLVDFFGAGFGGSTRAWALDFMGLAVGADSLHRQTDDDPTGASKSGVSEKNPTGGKVNYRHHLTN
jgi:hypothetical protein